MTDDIWRRAEIQSPCVKICVMHAEARMCLGCYRTPEEITDWARMTPEERRRIMDELPSRKSRLPGRRGGRAGRVARQGGDG